MLRQIRRFKLLKNHLVPSYEARRNYCERNLPELTKDRYPHLQRGAYATLEEFHFKFFESLLGEARVLKDPAECQGYNIDWLRNVRGYSQCVLKPRTTEEMSKILAFCNQHKLAVCPQSGNTSLVGGATPVFDEIVISMSLMNKILSIDDITGIVMCEAGCVLESLDDAVKEKGLMIPIDLGAKGSCFIGGNVSTNAGGLRLLRYGNLQGNVLGLEAVLANGQVIDLMSDLKKDNTGYHLKHMFIGSEGSLGVVTKVALQCPSKPNAINVAFLGVNNFEDVLTIFKKTKEYLGEILSSYELIDDGSLSCVTDNLKLQSPILKFPFYVLIETNGSHGDHDEEKLNSFLSYVMEQGLVKDGTVASEPSKIAQIWSLRERITEGLTHDGYVFKYDLSLPIRQFYSPVDVMRKKLGDDAIRVCGYGHIGDSNIHLNVCVKEYTKEVHKKIEPFIYEYISNLKGSISAEHGIGVRKPQYLHYSKDAISIKLMNDLKKFMDPNKILNPYKVIPM